MGKFGKREKIILGVMAIAILYAAFEFLYPKAKTSPAVSQQKVVEQRTADLNKFVADLNASLDRDWMKNVGTLIFSRAESPWRQDPFLDGRSHKAWLKLKETAKEVKAPPPKIDFFYSGFIELGQKRMGIINGIEYREGQPLEIKGYVLKSLNAERAIIENSSTGATENIPLQD